jgi:glyoxylase-like metal-dependent hydrolase (beta-lactamase superfamily II)
MDYRVISIGTLSGNEFWSENPGGRTAHATTTLIRSGPATILVDPGLPPQVIAARLHERSGLRPDAVTHVFLTCFRPAHRWGLAAFEHAQWWIAEAERETLGRSLVEQHRQADDDATRRVLADEIALLKRCAPAPDKLAPQVDLFPLPGFSPGTCGLLLCEARRTILVAGDAVTTCEHLEHGRVPRGAYDLEQARASFAEAVEIADLLIPGHDNLCVNPGRGS